MVVGEVTVTDLTVTGPPTYTAGLPENPLRVSAAVGVVPGAMVLGLTCALGAQPGMAPALAQPRLLLRQPRRGELGDQLAKPAARDTGADTMRQGRTGPS